MKINLFKKEQVEIDPLESLKNDIISTNEAGLKAVRNNHQLNFDRVWNNTQYTAQEVFNAFGTSAGDLLDASYATQQFIKFIDPTYQILVPPKNFTRNEDNTVTIAEEETVL